MSAFSVRTLASWYDAILDPDDLDLVRAAVNQHLPRGAALDWDRLLASEAPRQAQATLSFPYGHAAYFTSALETLCDGQAANTEALTFLPVPLAASALDLSRPGWRWRLYSTQHMLARWERLGATSHAETERLASAYRGPETARLQPREAWSPVTAAACLLALKTIAETATRWTTPAEVHW